MATPNHLFSSAATALLCLTSMPAALHAQELGGMWGTARAEAEYYRIVDVPLPEGLDLEAGSFTMLPDGRLAVGTRRGEILLIRGAFDPVPRPQIETFARGLDEVLGLGYRDGAFYATQQSEVTRITDQNGDGRADRFETLSDRWGFEHYHEFAWGSRPDPEGNTWVVLGLSSSYHYRARFRGWSFKITPAGKAIPVASGIRSAGGIGPNEHGVMFYTESQGPWNGSCSLKHLKPGGFMGHPISFEAYDEAPSMGKRPAMPENRSRLHIEAQRIPELVPYAVVFPYRKMGQSISGFRIDRSGGKFGPFQNQIFVGDYSLSIVMRATTELVNGVWQGACYPFREGMGNGILAVEFAPSGPLITGGTNRGWPVRGNRRFCLERLDWTGRTPFEILRIEIRPQGFAVHFTQPVDPKTVIPANFRIGTFTHIYQKFYGSPEVDQTTPAVTKLTIGEDGRTVTVELDALQLGHVHSFDLGGVKNDGGAPLVHRRAYYTVNAIPK